MFELSHTDITATSELFGDISIACWVVCLIPQIWKNFRDGFCEGLSVAFLLMWLLGDIFNMVGVILQHGLLTMLILAIYYTFADIVLLGQYFYYNGFTLKNPRDGIKPGDEDSSHASSRSRRRRSSWFWTFFDRHVPRTTTAPAKRQSALSQTLRNTLIVVSVTAAGFLGWLFTYERHMADRSSREQKLRFSVGGQVLGYLSAILYLASRLPQLRLNHKRKSTDGLSILLFVFAWLGNGSYVVSIMMFDPYLKGLGESDQPDDAAGIYRRYVLVNLSWILGSAGVMFFDMAVFVQYHLYNKRNVARGDGELHALEGQERLRPRMHGNESERSILRDDM